MVVGSQGRGCMSWLHCVHSQESALNVLRWPAPFLLDLGPWPMGWSHLCPLWTILPQTSGDPLTATSRDVTPRWLQVQISKMKNHSTGPSRLVFEPSMASLSLDRLKNKTIQHKQTKTKTNLPKTESERDQWFVQKFRVCNEGKKKIGLSPDTCFNYIVTRGVSRGSSERKPYNLLEELPLYASGLILQAVVTAMPSPSRCTLNLTVPPTHSLETPRNP